LFSSPNIIRIIKPKRTLWTRHITRMGETTYANKIFVGISEVKSYLADLGADGTRLL